MKIKRGDRINEMAITLLCLAFCASFLIYVSNASDPPPLKDFCVGVNDPDSEVFVNGELCKNPKSVTIDDFLYKGFNISGDTNNLLGANATLVDVSRLPAVNTLGVAMARIDFGPFGLNTPHWHPRSSEILAVMKGSLYAGFVATDYTLYDTILNTGDMIVFPQGLPHFQINIGNKNAIAFASFGSQNPGRVNVARSAFGTSPRIRDDVLIKAFQVNANVIKQLRAQFSTQNVVSIEKGRSIMMNFFSQAF